MIWPYVAACLFGALVGTITTMLLTDQSSVSVRKIVTRGRNNQVSDVLDVSLTKKQARKLSRAEKRRTKTK